MAQQFKEAMEAVEMWPDEMRESTTKLFADGLSESFQERMRDRERQMSEVGRVPEEV